MARALMIQGTGSGAGKSLITAAFCRIFSDMNLKVAPFKAQNMALNSYITADGGEIGRAQGLQAEAARIEPTTDMNPILLKASGDMGSQVIIQGKVHSTMKAREYYAFKKDAWEAVKDSYDRLSQAYDYIVLEGAGSPAEINLMDVDIVNMKMAAYARAPVLLVGDIDKGGVFAAIYGTVKLLGRQSRHIKGFVINKFRGDKEILDPGLEMIKQKTGKPVIGVLPFVSDLGLPEEDGLALSSQGMIRTLHKNKTNVGEAAIKGSVKITVIRLPYISNFTDFDPFCCEPDVELVYSVNPAEIENSDLIILPGSKNTIRDFQFLKDRGLDGKIKNAFARGRQIIGICGGYQMLGRKIKDPHNVESPCKEMEGVGLLDIETTFDKVKTTCQVIAELIQPVSAADPGQIPPSRGYEIHMGQSTGDIGIFKLTRMAPEQEQDGQNDLHDGSIKGNCWGTYLHGLFENDTLRRSVINHVREQKSLAAVDSLTNYSGIKDRAIDNLAGMVKENVDMEFVRKLVCL